MCGGSSGSPTDAGISTLGRRARRERQLARSIGQVLGRDDGQPRAPHEPAEGPGRPPRQLDVGSPELEPNGVPVASAASPEGASGRARGRLPRCAAPRQR